MIKEVLVIFKTHLDIGFTNFSAEVISNYLKNYIPNAIRVGYELKDTDTPFVWTVGSWLIWEALKNDADKKVENAIKDGIIRWHALPFTSHTELMNEELFEYGLSLSKRLDERFGLKTTAAKMTDVPGHTIAMIPQLAKNGVRFLHIGVNPATPLPPVPDAFRWQYGDESIAVVYQGAYGLPAEFGETAVYFAHTNDNHGPQNKDEIVRIYDDVKKLYPGAVVRAGTIEDLAERVCADDNLPVVKNEIGDTWIHGCATDPRKISGYRKLLRHISKEGIGGVDISDNLFLVPEHTCGLNIMVHFPFAKDYTHTALEKYKNTEEFKKMERSWDEQRSYVETAEKLFGIASDYPVEEFDISGYEKTDDIDFDAEICWQLFDNSDYERYQKDYMRLTDQNRGWALWDFTKIGLEDYEGGIFEAKITGAYKKGDEKIFRLEFDKETAERYALPYFMAKINGNSYDIRWFGKKASRLPQAFWLKFKGIDGDWELNKLGEWIKAEDVLGSPLLSAVNRGVRCEKGEIMTLDAPLVAPYGKKLLQYNVKNLKSDMHFILYDNIWNTNFPMWYSDDSIFRFEVKRYAD